MTEIPEDMVEAFGCRVIVSDAVPDGQMFVGTAKADFVRGKLIDVWGVKIVNLPAPPSD
jgi:hypothetical protein